MTKPINVLFIDDDENILKSVHRTFLSETYGVATVTEAETALNTIENNPVKVVVSDYRMPEVNGVDFLNMVKDKYPDLIRILFTGYADVEAAEDAVNISEVYRFISKPWNGDELKNNIQKAIEHYDLIQENKELYQVTKEKNMDLKKLNVKLEALYEKQKSFTSLVSHELRTPLASIKAAIDVVMSRTAGDLSKSQSEFLGKAKNNIDRLNRLINDILDLSKLESGNMQLRLEDHDLNQVIQEVIEAQEPIVKEKNLYLKADLDGSMTPFSFDADKVNEVLVNLIHNAIKFTEQGGISVISKKESASGHALIIVEDTGRGILEEDIPKLFKKFQQLESSHENKSGGTGLGLAICWEIVQRHGGKIWIESKMDKGSRFCFLLPLSRDL